MNDNELRDRVIALWDGNDAWIPGADYARLAEALGVPPERLLSHRQGGQSCRPEGAPDHNIAIGGGLRPLQVPLKLLRKGDVFTTVNESDVPYGAAVHHVTHRALRQVAVYDRNGHELLQGDADRVVQVER